SVSITTTRGEHPDKCLRNPPNGDTMSHYMINGFVSSFPSCPLDQPLNSFPQSSPLGCC
ncbi:hypothetical protein HAX54_000082, partial [Datura stramonium]|nr:hypothetical protein [Datura stramonium]